MMGVQNETTDDSNGAVGRLPILALTWSSFKAPFQNIGHLIKSLGLLLIVPALLLASTLLPDGGAGADGAQSDAPKSIDDIAVAFDHSNAFDNIAEMVGGMVAGTILLIVIGSMALVWLFNYWVRVTALTPAEFSQSIGEWFSQMISNWGRFIGISFLISLAFTIVGIVLIFIVSALGLVDSSGSSISDYVVAMVAASVGMYLMMILPIVYIYALFSPSLVNGALGRMPPSRLSTRVKQQLASDRTLSRFSIILLIIYVAFQLPDLATTALPDAEILLLVLPALQLLFVPVVGAAHGLADRHRRVIAESLDIVAEKELWATRNAGHGSG